MTNDGGPAFPQENKYLEDPVQGMSLRDWYAGMALQGRISSKLYPVYDAPDLAYACYAFADAMLKARGQ